MKFEEGDSITVPEEIEVDGVKTEVLAEYVILKGEDNNKTIISDSDPESVSRLALVARMTPLTKITVLQFKTDGNGKFFSKEYEGEDKVEVMANLLIKMG